MKERQIPFSGEMLRAILDGRKTQTRRAVKPRVEQLIRCHAGDPGDECEVLFLHNTWLDDDRREHGPEWLCYAEDCPEEGVIPIGQCPYGQPGDRLWVREPWKTEALFDPLPPRDVPRGSSIWYLAEWVEPDRAGRYRHARFMPRWASRMTLEITNVRVERLQEISEADAAAEGARCADPVTGREVLFDKGMGSYRLHFQSIWESINGPGSWGDNPWVWVVEFRRVEQESAAA